MGSIMIVWSEIYIAYTHIYICMYVCVSWDSLHIYNYSFGYHIAEVIGAMVSIMIVW